MHLAKNLDDLQNDHHYNPSDFDLTKELHYVRDPYCSGSRDAFCDMLMSHIKTISADGVVFGHVLFAAMTDVSRYKIRRALAKLEKIGSIGVITVQGNKKLITIKSYTNNLQQVRHSPVLAMIMKSTDAAELVGHLSFLAEKNKTQELTYTDSKLRKELNWSRERLFKAKTLVEVNGFISYQKSWRFTRYKVNLPGIKLAIRENRNAFEVDDKWCARQELFYRNNSNCIQEEGGMCDMASKSVRFAAAIYKAYTSTTISSFCLSSDLGNQPPDGDKMTPTEPEQPSIPRELPKKIENQLPKKPKTTPKSTIPISQLLNEFSVFVNSYPKARRSDKFYFKAFVEARNKASLEALLGALKAESAQRDVIKARRGFVPALLDGENWLKSERWIRQSNVVEIKSPCAKNAQTAKGGWGMWKEQGEVDKGSPEFLKTTQDLHAATAMSFESYTAEYTRLMLSGATREVMREFQLNNHPYLKKSPGLLKQNKPKEHPQIPKSDMVVDVKDVEKVILAVSKGNYPIPKEESVPQADHAFNLLPTRFRGHKILAAKINACLNKGVL